MDEKPKRVQEVVWTGKSNRKLRDTPEVFEPKKTGLGRTVYEVTRDPNLAAGKGGTPLYTDQPEAPAAKPAPPVQPAQPPTPAKTTAAAAKPAAKPPVQPTAPRPTAAPVAKAPAPAARPHAQPLQPTPATPREHSRVIAKTVVGSFVDRMKTEAERKGGTLTLKDIEALDQEFAEKTAALEVLFEKTFQEYVRNYSKAAKDRRHHPFDRLIVTAIERLFPRGSGQDAVKGTISRRILPGFFMAVNMMMGPDVMAEYRLKAGTVFDRVNKASTNGANWNGFVSDTEAQALRRDALVDMAVHFANPDKRASWFMDMINNHLSPIESDPETGAEWQLTRALYERLIDSMFSDLMAAVNDPHAREGITQRFGPETCASVVAIMKGLGA